MRLVCLLEHMKGQQVLVQGVEYTVDANGEAYVGNVVHAQALLANASGWMVKPDPLMPLGEDGKPEHVVWPQRQAKAGPDAPAVGSAVYEGVLADFDTRTAPATEHDILAAAQGIKALAEQERHANAQQVLGAPPFGFDGGPVQPEDIIRVSDAAHGHAAPAQAEPKTADARIAEREAAKFGTTVQPAAPDGSTPAAATSKPVRVSTPTAPPDARLGKQAATKKGYRK